MLLLLFALLAAASAVCPPNSQHSECGLACAATCENPHPTSCPRICLAGCVCDSPYVLLNGSCVLIENCPAVAPAPETTAAAAAPVPGGKVPIDVTSSAVLSAATCAMQLENARSNSLYALQLVQVVSATSQVVSGVRYDLVLQAGFSSTCRNDGTTHTLSECPVAASTTYEASVIVQPWLSTPCSLVSFSTATVAPTVPETTQPACGAHSTYSECGSACPKTCEEPNPQICVMMCVFGCVCDDGYLLHNGECILPAACPASQADTTAPAAAVPAGGAVPIDVNDADVVAAALCAMEYENARSNNIYTLQLVSIASATTQVVAGIRYNLQLLAGYSTACRNDGSAHTLDECPVTGTARVTYEASVVLQPWLSPSCNVISFSVAPATTPALLGGKTPVDAASSEVLSAATCAMQLENARSNSLYSLQLVSVSSATSQVVSGVKYDLVLQAGFSSTCLNDGTTHTLTQCPVTSSTTYEASVLVQAWKTPQCSLLSFTASGPATTAPATGLLVGGPIGGVTSAQVTSPLVQRAAVCAVADLNARSNAIFQTQLVQVTSATQQVVSGVKLTLTFLAAPSLTCLNDGSTPNVTRCPVDANTATAYQATVVMQPWKAQACQVVSSAAPVTDSESDGSYAGSSRASSASRTGSGAIAGIVVGVIVGVVLIALVTMTVVRRHRATSATMLTQDSTLEDALIAPET